MSNENTLLKLLANALPHLPDVMTLHDLDGNYRLVSPKMKDATGWRPSDLVGRSPYELLHPEDIPIAQRRYHDAMLGGASVQGRLRFRHRDGHYVWLEFTGVPIFDGPEQPRRISSLFTVNRVVTPLVQAERIVREQSRHLVQMQDMAQTAWFTVDLKTARLDHSESFVEITGRAASTFKNLLSLYRLVHPSDRNRTRNAFSALRRLAPGESQTLEVRIWASSHQTRWVRISLCVSTDLSGSGIERPVLSGVLLDIDDLVRSREETRRWVRQQEIGRARERVEIGHQLHDEVGQILIGLKWQIETWQRACARTRAAEPARPGSNAATQATNAPVPAWMESLDEAHQTLRRIAQRLRPSLAALGLHSAIIKLAEEYVERWLGQTRLDLQIDDDLPDGDEWRVNVILGMLRECLNNVARHAEARQVTVVAFATPARKLLLSVRDDGKGMDLRKASAPGRIGLTSLRERAHMIDAQLSIDTAPGKGTCVTFELALDGDVDD